jgi:2',3'-cyclic-nucleotide 2'-phosphodiesterase (5'-nucleotidase family)
MKEGIAMLKRPKAEMGEPRLRLRVVALLIVLGLVVSCGGTTPEADSQVSPLAPASPLLPTVTMAPTATPAPAPIQLTILHTNDNWGETEPCG